MIMAWLITGEIGAVLIVGFCTDFVRRLGWRPHVAPIDRLLSWLLVLGGVVLLGYIGFAIGLLVLIEQTYGKGARRP